MDNFEGDFIIEVNYQPISKVEENGEPQVHASLGPDPAVFKLVDGRLESGNWVLGRSLIEDRSLLPKRVFWFDKQQTDMGSVQKTTAVPQDGSYTLEFAGKKERNDLNALDRG